MASAPSALSFSSETSISARTPQTGVLFRPCNPPKRPRPYEFRTPTINTGSLSHANGSAVVRTGDTAVVCGVRAEILRASDIPHPYTAEAGSRELEELGLLVPNLELSTGCSPAHLPGNPPSTQAQSLSQRILSLLHVSKLVNVDDLRVRYQPPPTDDETPDEPPPVVTKAYWTLYMDIWVIGLDGNAFDAAWAAAIAALRDVKLPKAWWDADREAVVCSDAFSESRQLTLNGLPVASTFAVFSNSNSTLGPRKEPESWVLADPDEFEEELCNETVTVVVTPQRNGSKGGILKIEKSGGGVVGKERLRDLVDRAEDRWSDWERVLMQENTG
ncbi:hypothetical protein H2203_005925 [Taxawa tesnikishii (nom. ined.)]|nr:hypothetical protein H2203_005925 [Dothideales sp. JES 119]